MSLGGKCPWGASVPGGQVSPGGKCRQGASVPGGQVSPGGMCRRGACVPGGQVSLRGQVSQGASVLGANVAQSTRLVITSEQKLIYASTYPYFSVCVQDGGSSLRFSSTRLSFVHLQDSNTPFAQNSNSVPLPIINSHLKSMSCTLLRTQFILNILYTSDVIRTG